MATPQFTIDSQDQTSTFGRFVIEPLPQGFGHTLGNSLRRVLYTSIPGAAITSVSIAGVTHQFTTIEGVKEDVVQLVLNLKQARLDYSGSAPVTITLSAKGQAEVKAGDFELPSSVKISNPDLVIAHLSDKSSRLQLEAVVESGYGYSPAEDRKSTTLGQIPLDATFTPVTRINFTVVATRVGRVTNFDKLVLEIITTGATSPSAVLTAAAQTLVDYYSAIVNPTSPSQSSASAQLSPAVSPKNPTGNLISVEELDLPTRIANALQKAGFETVGQLLSVPKAELAKVKNLGSKSVKIIEIALRERGFELP